MEVFSYPLHREDVLRLPQVVEFSRVIIVENLLFGVVCGRTDLVENMGVMLSEGGEGRTVLGPGA
jgi:hypothetical protein